MDTDSAVGVHDYSGRRSFQMLKSLVLVISLAIAALAQNENGLNSVKPKYTVGQTLRYSVTFEGDPNFTTVTLYFNSSTPSSDQAGLSSDFSINQTKRIGPGQFDVEGQIPDTTATGTYELRTVQPRIAPRGVKDYDAKNVHIVLEVENPVKYRFPPLKDVKPK